MRKGIALSVIMFSLIASLSGCTGGDILGLVPAPRILSGSIDDNNVYIAKDKRFTVSVPFAENTDNHMYMKVKENYGPTEDYVSFGPGAVDQRIWRVEVVLPTPGRSIQALDAVAPQVLAATEHLAQQAYGTTPTAGEGQKTMVNGHAAYVWDLQQSVPSMHATLAHKLYLIDFGSTMATVWVQTPSDNLTDQRALTPEQFAESLKVAAATAAP